MRPIYLKMTAFGSYCGTAEVDFTKLYDNGIFLITGKTGGGKTTILDAICMALYGKATGTERAKEWRQMRCNNSPNNVDTEIEYIFSIDNTRYKFYRRWHIPNTKNGEFRVDDSENACYICREREENWTPIAANRAAVNNAAENILKLTQTQFVKVIMLPQGEFRELLTASSDEKEDIFKKLFDTWRWEEITSRASEEFRRLDNECKSHNERRSMALKNAACETADQLKEKISQYKNQLSKLNVQAEQNLKKSEQTAAALKSAEDAAALCKALEEQKTSLEKLNTYSQAYTEIEQKLIYSRKLRGVLPQFNLMRAAQISAEKAEKALNSAKKNEKAALDKLLSAQEKAKEIPAMEEKRHKILSALANFNTLAESKAKYSPALAELSNAAAELRRMEQHLEKLRSAKDTLEQQIATGNSYLEKCYAASDQLISIKEKETALSDLFKGMSDYESKLKQRTELIKILSDFQGKVSAEEQNFNSLTAIANAVERAIRYDKAYSLTADLREGAPCPVCGSIHHPNIAKPSENTPSADELEKCKNDAENSRKRMENLRSDCSAKQAELDILEKNIKDLRAKYAETNSKSSVELKSELDTVCSIAADLQKLSGQTSLAKERIKQRNDELVHNGNEIETANKSISDLRVKISYAEQTVNTITESLKARGIADFNQLDGQIKSCKSEQTRIESTIFAVNSALTDSAASYSSAEASAKASAENLCNAQSELSSSRAEYSAKCAEIGIADDTEVAGGVLSDKIEAEYEQKITSYKQQLSFAKKRIEELTVQLDGKSMPDIDALRAANSAAITEGQEIARQSGNISTQMNNLIEISETIRREDEFLEKLSRDYETARRLNQLFSGINESRTPIHQYVIGIKMDEVIMSANLYLHKLTKGQYSMKRKESIGGRAKHQGLDIEILDSSAGRVRAVSTLSGGELFLASLSLAFGLSDVVQSFAGGIHLDSLFIDEGFGSLDSETLDVAMEAITQVRENKLLGIISHVSELKERIPYGIEVIKTPDGSSLKMRI